MCTPDFITWIRKADFITMCTPDFITWIRKAGYVYT